MLTISEDDYRTLEQKIQNEVQKIFLQFLEDREHQAAMPEPAIPHEPEAPRPLHRSDRARSHPHVSQKPRGRSKKSVEALNRLQGLSPVASKAPRSILEEDMEKILKLKPRKKAD